MKTIALALVMALAATGCSNLGLDEADCSSVIPDVSSSNILTVQAVPTAQYTPCLNELPLGWDMAKWFAESGRAGFDMVRFVPPTTFLTAVVTDSCDVTNAVAVESRYFDIERFEDIELQPVDIEISVVPSGERPLVIAELLINRLAGGEIDGRPLIYTIDERVDESVSQRVELALSHSNFVLVIDEVDAEEGTVQLRSNILAAAGHDLDPQDALDLIKHSVPEVFYRGSWYFTFEGGCITYDFDAKGILAESVAEGAEGALGFYPALELRQFAADQGFDIG